LFKNDNHVQFRDDFRKKNGISTSQRVIVYCGRIDETKGVLELVEAFKMIKDTSSILLIIGSSAYLHGAKTKYVKKVKIAAESVRDRVIFTGYVTQKELPKYYSVADVAVVPSKCQEAAGNVIIEALSCSIPVIASRRGGIPEYASVDACVLVECDDEFTLNLYNAIKKMILDESYYLSKKNQARRIALEYSKANYYRNFLNSLNKLNIK
jgi:glycosyltransferase involved in cell wall biosynthesis